MITPIDGIGYSFSSRLPLNARKSIQFLLVRTLLGAAKIHRDPYIVIQSIDYSHWPSRPQAETGARAFDSYLESYGLGHTPASFVRETIADNRRLFQDVLSELANYFVESHRGCHTAAFVFLYRALERLSFSVPLLYCATASDFVGTFNDLKNLFKEGSSGEHGLLKKFLAQGRLIDKESLELTAVLDFSACGNHAERYYKVVVDRCPNYALCDPTRAQVEYSYKQIPDLFITLRNRFFHLRSGDGHKNISLAELNKADDFFGVVNKVLCDFLGFMTLHVIARKYMAR